MATSVYQQGGYGTAALFPNPIIARRDPTTTDRVSPTGQPYQIFQGWNNELTDNNFIYLGAGNWATIASVVGSINQLTSDAGVALPAAGNINVVGGSGVTTSAAGSTLTISLTGGGTAIDSFVPDAGTNPVVPTALGAVTMAGTANQITTTGGLNTLTFSIPAIFIAPGTITATTSVTSPIYTAPAATDLDINAVAGQDIDVTLGDAAGANNISFFSSTPSLITSLDSLGNWTTQGDMIASRSDAGVDVTVEATNSDNTSLTSNAFFEAAVGGAAGGDAGIRFQVSGVATNWSAGLDNSDSDAWVLSASNTIGTSNALRFDHTSLDAQFGGDVDLPAGNLTVSGTITADEFVETITEITLTQSPLLQSNANTGAAPSGATGDVNLMSLQSGEIMEQFILGAGQTIIAPRMAAAGLLTSLDLVAAEGAEYNWGMRANASPTFVIGTSPAFFFELEVTAADIGGLDPFLAGFRIVQANDATLANYTDFAAIGANATTAADVVIIQTQLNTGGVVITNTTDAWLDTETRTFRINVSAAGVVTYLINGAPPTATAAFTFDNGDRVAPFIRHLFGAATPGAINWVRFQYGLQ